MAAATIILMMIMIVLQFIYNTYIHSAFRFVFALPKKNSYCCVYFIIHGQLS